MARKAKSVGTVRQPVRRRFRLRPTVAVNVVPAGQILLHRFISAVRSGAVPPADVLHDLAARLQQILDGMEPKKALGLQRGKGVKRTAEQQFKEQDIAWDVADLYEQMGRGTLEKVCAIVGRKHHKSGSAIKEIYLAERRRRPQYLARKKTNN